MSKTTKAIAEPKPIELSDNELDFLRNRSPQYNANTTTFGRRVEANGPRTTCHPLRTFQRDHVLAAVCL